MEAFWIFLADFSKLVIPSAFVIYGMYLVIKGYLSKDLEKKLIEVRQQTNTTILPIRLQAYERMSIFLERIAPANLITRLNQHGANVAALQNALINEIRSEFNYNLSQQVYMSDKVWESIRIATEDTIALINTCAEHLEKTAPSMELAKVIISVVMESGRDVIKEALVELKSEIQKTF